MVVVAVVAVLETHKGGVQAHLLHLLHDGLGLDPHGHLLDTHIQRKIPQAVQKQQSSGNSAGY
jgi:hypothetical protein